MPSEYWLINSCLHLTYIMKQVAVSVESNYVNKKIMFILLNIQLLYCFSFIFMRGRFKIYLDEVPEREKKTTVIENW